MCDRRQADTSDAVVRPGRGAAGTDPAIPAIRQVLRGRTDVRVAIVFGSRARSTATRASDVDVAVSAPGADLLQLAADLSRATGREVDVRARRKPSAEELARDRDALDLVAFNLMLAVQAGADVASHLIADEGWAAAETLGGAFERSRDQRAISPPVCAALGRAVGLRDVVAHGYAGVCPEMIHGPAIDAETGITSRSTTRQEGPMTQPLTLRIFSDYV
jgi:predicted nucleotidyltransferase